MIHSIYIGDDADLVQRVLTLHGCPAGAQILDATYGHGGFWRIGVGNDPGPEHDPWRIVGLDSRMAGPDLDLARSRASLVAGDYQTTPFRDNTFKAIVFDPPFLTRAGESSIMRGRYDAFESYDALLISLERARDEFKRILHRDGFIVAKVMDWTEGRRRRWLHIDLFTSWEPTFRLDDVIVKVTVQNPRSTTWKRQNRSKSSHVYFMVFRPILRRKPSRPRALSTNGTARAPARELTQLSLSVDGLAVSSAEMTPGRPLNLVSGSREKC